MRQYLTSPNSASGSSKLILLASVALLLSAFLQLATSWMQMHSRENCRGESVQSISNPGQMFLINENDYTWEGDDYPNALPLDLGDPVTLTIEDSRHYALDSPDADAEYRSIYPGKHLGFIRLGPKRRFFGLSMYHQIHCLDSLRNAILGRHGHGGASHEKRDVEHSHHCLNYLRQTIMCNADMTLEPEIREGSQDVGEGLAVTHVCKDWSKVHAFVEENEKWAWGNISTWLTPG
ncbi:hypothetical protein QCA50_013413 [Cerrena zonata]|uniref:Uncharacterized protein n=1 Tax=Cerrena zonata TaxID=2478898 RepID=A0AAW0G3D8_9APHY